MKDKIAEIIAFILVVGFVGLSYLDGILHHLYSIYRFVARII